MALTLSYISFRQNKEVIWKVDYLSLLTICTAEEALNLPTTPFLFVSSDIFPAARAIKPHLHATSGFSGIGVLKAILMSQFACLVNVKW